MNEAKAQEVQARLAELQEAFSRIGRELEMIRDEIKRGTPGSKADQINALHDEAGGIVDEWQELKRNGRDQ